MPIPTLILGVLFVAAGILHFLIPQTYARIVPPYLPAPLTLVYISGLFEVAGGIGVLIPSLRQAAGWGLIALLIAVFPANIYMAQNHIMISAAWIGWARLPLQALLIWWVFACTQR